MFTRVCPVIAEWPNGDALYSWLGMPSNSEYFYLPLMQLPRKLLADYFIMIKSYQREVLFAITKRNKASISSLLIFICLYRLIKICIIWLQLTTNQSSLSVSVLLIYSMSSPQTNGFDSLQFSRRIQERRIVAEDLQLQEHELASADQSDLEVCGTRNTWSCSAGMNGIITVSNLI